MLTLRAPVYAHGDFVHGIIPTHQCRHKSVESVRTHATQASRQEGPVTVSAVRANRNMTHGKRCWKQKFEALELTWWAHVVWLAERPLHAHLRCAVCAVGFPSTHADQHLLWRPSVAGAQWCVMARWYHKHGSLVRRVPMAPRGGAKYRVS